jgi:hypothetical protein
MHTRVSTALALCASCLFEGHACQARADGADDVPELHLGDVIVEEHDIFGDGLNVAGG